MAADVGPWAFLPSGDLTGPPASTARSHGKQGHAERLSSVTREAVCHTFIMVIVGGGGAACGTAGRWKVGARR